MIDGTSHQGCIIKSTENIFPCLVLCWGFPLEIRRTRVIDVISQVAELKLS